MRPARTEAAGALLAVWSAGSLVGGLVGGARPARRGRPGGCWCCSPARRPRTRCSPRRTGLLLLGGLLVLAGALVAPALGGIYTLVEQAAPPAR